MARTPIDTALTQPVRPIYFSVMDGMGREQLMVRESGGQVHSLFLDDNQGFFDSVSPDGNTITFERWNWLAPDTEPGTLWLGDLRRGTQTMIASAPDAKGTIGGSWSPDGQYLCVGGLYAVAPLWAGYNYGYSYIYKVADHSIISLPDPLGFVLGWYPDSQHLLAWRQNVGYFKYNISESTTSPLPLPNLKPDVKQHLYGGALSSTLPYLAIVSESFDGIGLYDANTGSLLQQVHAAIPDIRLSGFTPELENGTEHR